MVSLYLMICLMAEPTKCTKLDLGAQPVTLELCHQFAEDNIPDFDEALRKNKGSFVAGYKCAHEKGVEKGA